MWSRDKMPQTVNTSLENLLKERCEHLEQIKILKEQLYRAGITPFAEFCSPKVSKRHSLPAPPTVNLHHVDSKTLGTYGKRSGTTDFGKQYEYLMCAFYALKFATSDDVLEFQMTTNHEIYGDFDDIAIKVTFTSGTKHTYLLQLKHTENKKRLTETILVADKGDFSLAKYLKSFQSTDNRDNVSYILFTNRSAFFKQNSSFVMKDLDIFVVPNKHIPGQEMLDTCSSDKQSVFQFDTREDDETGRFLNQFYLFANQKNVTKVKTSIGECLQRLLQCDTSELFINFMKNWWGGNFILCKNDIIAKLAELAFGPFIETISDQKCTGKSSVLCQALASFDLTLVDTNDDVVNNVWMQHAEIREVSLAALKFGLTTKGISSFDELSAEQKTKALWYLNHVPLIVKLSDSKLEQVKSAVRLLNKLSAKKKLVLVGDGTEQFSELRSFRCLHDLRDLDEYQDIIDSFEVSLQGRKPISLRRLFNSAQDSKIISTKHLLTMTQCPLMIGDKKIDLPESYIARTVSTTFLDTESVISTANGSEILIITNTTHSFEAYLSARNISFLPLNDFDRDSECFVFLAEDCTKHQFDGICRETTKRRVHVLRLFDTKSCCLVLSSDNIFQSDDVRHQNESIKESDIYSAFDTPINVLCAQPGIGKSTLIKYLANNCAPECWSVKVNLRRFNSLLKEEPEEEEILVHFLELDGSNRTLLEQVKTLFVRNKKIYLFLDGLDEIESNCVDFALDYVNYIASTGVHVWISSRLNLQAVIATRLNVFPIDIEELTRDQQQVYINQRLMVKYQTKEIQQISEQVFGSANVANSHNMLGIPLQLYIITENFLNDMQLFNRLTEEIFVLTKMYTIFFEGKKKHLYEKAGVLNEQQLGFNFSLHLELYEVPALRCCLDATTFNKLDLKLSHQEHMFLDNIKHEGDNFGIISQVNDEHRAVFTHQTYAEYFACVWLRKNFHKVRLLEDDIHSERYQNLRLIFDIMLAENCPLHLAVIYRNVEQVNKHLKEIDVRDEGRRSALHLICCYGSRHEELQLEQSLYLNHLYHEESHFNGESHQYRKIFGSLLGCSPLEPDDVFGWTPLEYAVKFQCLYAVEQFLQNDKIKLTSLYKIFKTVHLAYYSSKLGYPRLLTAAIAKNPNVVYFRIGENKLSFLHVAVKSAKNVDNHQDTIEIIGILIGAGVSVNVRDKSGATALHLAVRDGSYDIVKALLACDADINATTFNDETIIHYVLDTWDQQAKLWTKDKTGVTALHWACIEGDYDLVKHLVDNHADVLAKTDLQETALHYAVRAWKPDLDIINLLLAHGVDVNAGDYFGTKALHWACDNAHYDVIKLLHRTQARITVSSGRTKSVRLYATQKPDMKILDLVIGNGFNVNARSASGTTVLHWVVQKGHFGLVQLLIANGASVAATTSNQETVLHFAARGSSPRLVKLFVEMGIDPNSRDVNGTTPLHVAAESGNHQVVWSFLQHGADVRAATDTGESVLTSAVKIGKPDPEIIALLLRSGADVNAQDLDGISALHWASERGHHSVLKTLLDYDADVNTTTHTGETALHYAAPNLEMINLLLARGVDVNAKDVGQMTALHWAAERGQLNLVRLLIESGADVNARNSDDETVLIYAVKQRKVNVDVVKLLVASGVDVDAADMSGTATLHWAAERRHCDVVKTLLDAGADVNLCTQSDETSLHHASRSWLANTDVIKRLVSAGVDINAQDGEGISALHLASKESDFVNVQLLVELGADVNLKTADEESVLHFAAKAWKINTNVMDLLMRKGVEVDDGDNNGRTALHCAAEKGFYDNVEFLLDSGANLDCLTFTNLTPLHFAVYGGHVKIVKLLLSRGLDLAKIQVRNPNLPLHFAQRNGVLREDLLTMMAATIRSRFPLLSWKRYSVGEVTTYLQEAQQYLEPPQVITRHLSTASSYSTSSISQLGEMVFENVSRLRKFFNFLACRRRRPSRTPTFIVHYPEFPTEDVYREQGNRTPTIDRSYIF